MKKKKIIIITVIFLFAGFIAFIFINERRLLTREQNEIKNYAKTIAVSMWDIEPKGPIEYLRLVSKRQKYKQIIVTHIDGEPFINIENKLQGKIENFLLSLKLIRTIAIKEDVSYTGNEIGEFRAYWYSTSVYFYFHTLIILFLFPMKQRYAIVARQNFKVTEQNRCARIFDTTYNTV